MTGGVKPPLQEKPGPPWCDRSWTMSRREKPGLGQGLGHGMLEYWNDGIMGGGNPPANAWLARQLQCRQTGHWRAGMGQWFIDKISLDRKVNRRTQALNRRENPCGFSRRLSATVLPKALDQ